MTIVDDLTPTQYGIHRGKMIVRGNDLASLRFQLQVHIYNASDQALDARYVDLSFSDGQKQAFLGAVAAAISDLEASTGLTRYEPPIEDLI